jgi:hypothetical protein
LIPSFAFSAGISAKDDWKTIERLECTFKGTVVPFATEVLSFDSIDIENKTIKMSTKDDSEQFMILEAGLSLTIAHKNFFDSWVFISFNRNNDKKVYALMSKHLSGSQPIRSQSYGVCEVI